MAKKIKRRKNYLNLQRNIQYEDTGRYKAIDHMMRKDKGISGAM